jgi:hypothetical protein
MIYVRDYRRVMDWWIDFLTTYTQHSELRVITELSLICALYKSLAHAKSSQSSPDFSWKRLLIVEIFQLPALRSYLYSRPSGTLQLSTHNYNAISSQPPLQSWAQLPTVNWTGCPNSLPYKSSARNTSWTLFFYSCVRVPFRGNVFTEPLLRNGRLFMPILQQRLHSLFISRSLSSNGSTSHNNLMLQC